MKTQHLLYLCLLIISCTFSCESGHTELIDFYLENVNSDITIDYETNTLFVEFADQNISGSHVTPVFSLSEGAKAQINNSIVVSGESEISFEKPFTLQIISENEKNSINWKVKPTNNNYSEVWGLGGFISKDISHKRAYEWYINQAETGSHAHSNCAPSCIVMAGKWKDRHFPYSVEDARNLYHSEGGGWSTVAIDYCLTDFNLKHSIIELTTSIEETTALLTSELDTGNIVLLCIDIHYLQLCKNDSVRVDKYYETNYLGSGHCILLKGYKIVDGECYFEVYDPIGYNYRYSDNEYMGKSRHYRDEDIFASTFSYWNYAFVISPGTEDIFRINAVDPKEIPNPPFLK